jgi:hypothetical protein
MLSAIRVVTESTKFDRLNGRIAWIDVLFVERQRTPEWAIQVGIRCHLAVM